MTTNISAKQVRSDSIVVAMISEAQGSNTDYHQPDTKNEISRGDIPKIERRVMVITAYTNHDPGMDGLGITASGEKTVEGRTIAAPPEIPFGAQIYVPELGKTLTVTDRGGAIKGNRLDLFMENREDALQFGKQTLEVVVRYERGDVNQ